jgi:AcrR family transcriptional regulator
MSAHPRKPAPDRKAEIVQIALRLAYEVGPERVTTGLIAAHLGLSQPAIYKHFPSKSDIWAAVARQIAARIGANIARATGARTTPDQRLRQLVMDHLRLIVQTPALPELMVSRDSFAGQTGARSQMASRISELHAALQAAVRAGIHAGLFRPDLDPQDAATLLLGIIQSLVLRMLMTRHPEQLLSDGDRLLTLQISGFERHLETRGDRP